MSYTVLECPLCEGERSDPLLKGRDFHYGNPGEYTLVRCKSCSLCFLNPMYDEAELSAFYPTDYYAFVDRSSENKPQSFKMKMRRCFLGDPEHQTKDPRFEQAGNMLDVGCGSGWFILKMKERGWRVQGVEPNAEAARFGRIEKGLDIFTGSLLDANFPSETFDYIRFNHSFEHMNNPNQILDEAYRILARGGKLMIGVPNRDGFNARLFGRYWWHLALPLHAFSYSTQTLSRMLTKHHFRIEKIVFNTEKTGIQGSMQLYFNRNDSRLTSEGRFSRSRLAEVLCIWAAGVQNVLGTADSIEITVTKQPKLYNE